MRGNASLFHTEREKQKLNFLKLHVSETSQVINFSLVLREGKKKKKKRPPPPTSVLYYQGVFQG